MKAPAAASLFLLVLLLAGSGLCSLEPAERYLTPSDDYLPPRQQRGPYAGFRRGNSAHRTDLASPPSTSYGVPDLASGSQRGYGYARHQHEEEQYNEDAARYGFEYRVNDGRGSDYGHREAREDGKTRGRYDVLLPDGRRQIVEYEADAAGFRPRIRYEETGRATAYPAGAPY